MNIQNLSYPFYHTIINNYFADHELKKIQSEFDTLSKSLDSLPKLKDDIHHQQLKDEFNTQTIYLDGVYQNKRDQSEILKLLYKIYDVDFNFNENPLLKYLKLSNRDVSTIQLYKNNSSYFKHIDHSVLTCLYIFWEQPKQFTGGDLVFTNYDYLPNLENNCCIIFPGFEPHLVTTLSSSSHNISRCTINYRVYINA
jgi:hypothetical protein